jgi:hypothetical protein
MGLLKDSESEAEQQSDVVVCGSIWEKEMGSNEREDVVVDIVAIGV